MRVEFLASVELGDLHPVIVCYQDVLDAFEIHVAFKDVAGCGDAVLDGLLVVGVAVPAVEPADVVDFAVVLVNVLLQFGIAHLARPVVVDGRDSVTHEVPGPAVDKQAVRFGLFLEPAENFVLLGGQVVAVVHDVLVEVFLVVERPCAEDDGDDDHARKCERLCLFLACGCCEVLDGVRDGERCDKRHAGQHHQAVALVNLDAKVARDVLENHVGLHARPATFFIQKANEFKSSIWVEKEERRVNAKSLLGVLSLGIMGGTNIRVIAGGPDEEQAVDELVKLVESGFAE